MVVSGKWLFEAAAAYPMDETRLFFQQSVYDLGFETCRRLSLSIHLFGGFCQFNTLLFQTAETIHSGFIKLLDSLSKVHLETAARKATWLLKQPGFFFGLKAGREPDSLSAPEIARKNA